MSSLLIIATVVLIGVMAAASIFLAHAWDKADENIKLWGSDPREGGE